MQKREKFASRIGFILVSAGCAIGLGNVWRFPYVVGENGGAAFIAIYLLFLALIGVPIIAMEFSVGRASQRSIAKGFGDLAPKGTRFNKFGPVGVFGNYLLMMFYTTVAGWMLYYFYKMLTGHFVGMNAEQIGADFGKMLSEPLTMGLWMVITVVISFGVCSLGVQKGVEKVTTYMMSALLILMVVMVFRSVTLPGSGKGIEFFLKPDIPKMQEIGIGKVVFNALGQAFFTLSIGMGSMMIFGSYLSKERTLAGEAVVVTALDTFVALMAGLIIIPACFAYGVEVTAGPGLIFVTLPNIFNSMPLGQLWGAAFFLFLSFAALSTVIAVFENIISFHMDLWNSSRAKATVVNIFLIIVLSIPVVIGFNVLKDIFQPFGPGTNVLDLEDFIISQNILPLGSLVFLFFSTSRYGWGWKNFIKEVNTGKGIKFPTALKTYCSTVIPAVVILVYIKGYWDFFVDKKLNPYVGLAISIVILLALFYVSFYRDKGTVPNE